MQEGFIHTNFSPPYPWNCLALNQQFFLKSVRLHLFFLFLRVFYRHTHSFLNWPFFKFSTYRHVLFLVTGGGNVGDRGNCFVQFDSLMTRHVMTRTRGTCIVFWAVTVCWTMTAARQCLAQLICSSSGKFALLWNYQLYHWVLSDAISLLE